ncbi:Carbohydrate kinase, FGGY() [Methylophaga lonarensis MPL]|uniref:Carbohydrate kinase, FGGY( ) n=1 Tax=Methylophaga lonarensis MPL TaxID=1286106 RepID=M7NYL1_9GAMM|nr:FGGY-family carbohydrate kinase [Methylophaga lonarensis]EMR12312.1 Carbohydrate kinase, FGGY() [Methylophaga lonarensis MPL]
MSDNAWIGIDLGTSGCRAIAIDDQGLVIAQQRSDFAHSQQVQTQQSPQQHWQLVKDCLGLLLSRLDAFKIIAIAVDATSGSVMLADSAGEAASALLMYHDTSASVEASLIKSVAPTDSAAHGLGSGLAKALYLRHHTQQDKPLRLLHQADWINLKLGVSRHITDYNTALKTGFDAQLMCWPDWINALIPSSMLPEVVAPGTVIGRLDNMLCDEFNLSESPMIVAGTTDSIAGVIATGAYQPGDAVTVLGSTLVLKIISERPIFVPALGVYSHRFDKHWLVGGASNCGAAVLRQFFDDETLKSLSEQINLADQPAAYYPLPAKGERFPVNDPNKQPCFSPRPDSDALFLHGLLKSLARVEAEGYQCIQKQGAPAISNMRTIGGGAGNPVWQALRQQYLHCPFLPVEQTEPAYGSAQLARKATQEND